MSPSDHRNTLRGSPVVVAPGKVFIMGEYAVLDGAPAVVAAVSRFAVGQFIAGGAGESPFVEEAVRVTLEGLGERAAALPAGSVWVDSAGFSAEGRKLGLGSSAAVTAATVGAMLEMAGLPIASNRDFCFTLAENAHRVAQGGIGSGADVAAAVHGGLLQFRRPPGGYPITERLQQPADLRIVIFSEGQSASTPDLVRGVKAFAERNPSGYASALRPLREQAELFAEAFAEGKIAALLDSARIFGTALGMRSGVPIVTTRFEIAANLAINLGGVAKPSGAGGGDIGVGLFGDEGAARTFASRVEQLGLRVLDAPIETKGVHRRQPSASL